MGNTRWIGASCGLGFAARETQLKTSGAECAHMQEAEPRGRAGRGLTAPSPPHTYTDGT